MKDNGKIIKNMDKELCILVMGKVVKVNGLMEKNKVMVYINFKMVINMKVNLQIIEDKVKDNMYLVTIKLK